MQHILELTDKIKSEIQELKESIEKKLGEFKNLELQNLELKKECEIALKNVEICLSKIEEIEKNDHTSD
jgi:cell shape-determining protein MreC